jgi:hypothetical protein
LTLCVNGGRFLSGVLLGSLGLLFLFALFLDHPGIEEALVDFLLGKRLGGGGGVLAAV